MSNESETSLRDLAAAYALGALSPEEAQQFEGYMANSPEARRDVAEFREAAALMARGNASTIPSPALKSKVLARIGQEKAASLPARAAWRSSPAMLTALAASVVFALIVGSLAIGYRDALTEREQALVSVEAQLADRLAMLNRILEPQVQLFLLTGQGAQAPGVQLFWDRERDVTILHAFNLPPAPAGQAYQLWLVPSDGSPPVSVVVFNSEPDGHALEHDIPVPAALGEFAAAAITVEPESGSPQPTSDPILIGQLSS